MAIRSSPLSKEKDQDFPTIRSIKKNTLEIHHLRAGAPRYHVPLPNSGSCHHLQLDPGTNTPFPPTKARVQRTRKVSSMRLGVPNRVNCAVRNCHQFKTNQNYHGLILGKMLVKAIWNVFPSTLFQNPQSREIPKSACILQAVFAQQVFLWPVCLPGVGLFWCPKVREIWTKQIANETPHKPLHICTASCNAGGLKFCWVVTLRGACL